jgi:uncharacterized protein (DUF362 family)
VDVFHEESTMDRIYERREMFRIAAGAAGAAVVPSFSSMTVRARASDAVSRVVLIATEDRIAGMRAAINALQPEGLAGKSIFLKPNFNTADPAPAATDSDLLEALVQELQQAGSGPITIGERSGMANTRAAMQTKGVFDLADQYGITPIVLDELHADGWQIFPPDGTHWRRGFGFARPALDADAVVTTCCLKTHRFGGHFTLSLKNTVGMVAKQIPGASYNYMTELHESPNQRLMIAEANAVYHPALIVLDGVEAFLNGGPDIGAPAKPGIVLAGTDRVAVDAVGIAMLRSLGTTNVVSQGSIWELDQIRRAVELGLGAPSPEQIDIVTPDDASRKVADTLRALLA